MGENDKYIMVTMVFRSDYFNKTKQTSIATDATPTDVDAPASSEMESITDNHSIPLSIWQPAQFAPKKGSKKRVTFGEVETMIWRALKIPEDVCLPKCIYLRND